MAGLPHFIVFPDQIDKGKTNKKTENKQNPESNNKTTKTLIRAKTKKWAFMRLT